MGDPRVAGSKRAMDDSRDCSSACCDRGNRSQWIPSATAPIDYRQRVVQSRRPTVVGERVGGSGDAVGIGAWRAAIRNREGCCPGIR